MKRKEPLVLEMLRDMPIITHKLEIETGEKRKLIIYQDFNCRFTKNDSILFTFWA